MSRACRVFIVTLGLGLGVGLLIARREKLRRTSSALRKVRTEHRAALDAFASSGKGAGASRKRSREGPS